jgi:hypothetical protein
LPQTFSENRLFIRSHEAEFFLDLFWNDFSFRCHLRTPKLTTDFTPHFMEGVADSQVIRAKGEGVRYQAVSWDKKNTLQLDSLFCKKKPIFELQNQQKLRLVAHEDSLYVQDVSQTAPVCLAMRPGVRCRVETGMVFGLGIRQQHKVRVVKATPWPRRVYHPDSKEMFLNQYNAKDQFLQAVQEGTVRDIQTMNDFAFRNVLPSDSPFTPELPEVVLEFFEGPKAGSAYTFTAVEDLANRDCTHFKIGHSKDSNVFLDDLDVCFFNLEFKFDSRFGWKTVTNAPVTRAFLYLRNWDQFDLKKSSFFHALAFNPEVVVYGEPWTLEKKVTPPPTIPVAPHRAAAAAAIRAHGLLLYQF